MNYIKEVNAFHNRLETNPLSAAAANLWHVLMHVNNRAGWLDEFTVAVSVLCAKASLTESTFKRARAELQDKGYISFKSQGGNRAAIYEIVSLANAVETRKESGHEGILGDSVEHVDQNLSGNLSDSVNRNVAPLIKQNKTKQNNATTTDAAAFFQENFGGVNAYVSRDMNKWANELGEPLVLCAMERALERGKDNWGYVKGILQAWVKKGIRSVDAARAEEERFRQGQLGRKGAWSFGGRAGTQEIVPDWFREQKRKEKLDRKRKVEVMPDPVVESEEIARLLARYSSNSMVKMK